MLVHRRVTPRIKFTSTHLYTWVKRDSMRIKCLAQEHNTMSLVRARTQTPRSGEECSNHEASASLRNHKLTKVTCNLNISEHAHTVHASCHCGSCLLLTLVEHNTIRCNMIGWYIISAGVKKWTVFQEQSYWYMYMKKRFDECNLLWYLLWDTMWCDT